MLRGVMDDGIGSIRQVPTGRSTTTEKIDDETIEVRIRAYSTAGPEARAIADQVFGHADYTEARCLIPAEVAFRGTHE